MPDVIKFYSVTEPFGEFSNFAPYPVELKGKRWPTSEHYFQAQKFAEVKDQEITRRARSPMFAARIGRDRRRKIRKDWESVKVSVMREVVETKFRQHIELQALLLSTGDARIVERADKDLYWGDGGDGCGKNMLGQILMDIRTMFRKDP